MPPSAVAADVELTGDEQRSLAHAAEPGAVAGQLGVGYATSVVADRQHDAIAGGHQDHHGRLAPECRATLVRLSWATR